MDSNGLIFVASNETLKDKAWNLHNVGLPPSKIAKKLNISEDEARKFVVEKWKEDRERYTMPGR